MSATANGSDVAGLRDEVAALRGELAQLRADMTAEVRTGRLVVVDEHGVERIKTMVRDGGTSLELCTGPLLDIGFGGEGRAAVELWAADGDSGHQDGWETASAKVICSTGDDSYAILEQLQVLAEDKHTVNERGSVSLYQQRSRRGLSGKLEPVGFSEVKLDGDGLTECEIGGDVTAYAPMMRAHGGR